MKNSITVGILTYKRNELLKGLLGSILDAVNPEDDVSCVVVDTSGECIAEPVVHQIMRDSVVAYEYYGASHRLSIPEGRNAVLDRVQTDWLLFIDDDELVLADLFSKINLAIEAKPDCKLFKLGVQAVTSDGKPSNWHDRDIPFEHGTEFDPFNCATNGILVDMNIIREHHFRFDPYWSADGGEDNAFFFQFRELGHRACSLKDLKILEIVNEEREKLSALLKVSMTRGVAFAKLQKKLMKRSTLSIAFEGLRNATSLLVKTFVAAVIRREKIPSLINLAFKNIGVIIGALGGKLNYYK